MSKLIDNMGPQLGEILAFKQDLPLKGEACCIKEGILRQVPLTQTPLPQARHDPEAKVQLGTN